MKKKNINVGLGKSDPVKVVDNSQNTLALTGIQSNTKDADQKLLDLIAKLILDPTKIREFDCLFLSTDEKTAIDLQLSLSQNHNYKITKSYKDDDGWITNGVKEMVHADLESSLDQAKNEAAKYSSRLFDWNFDVDSKLDKSV